MSKRTVWTCSACLRQTDSEDDIPCYWARLRIERDDNYPLNNGHTYDVCSECMKKVTYLLESGVAIDREREKQK